MVESKGLSSTERKRIRDRRAQQKHRERKDSHIQKLEDQAAFCQRNHEPARIRVLAERVGQMEALNDTLLRENNRLLQLANHIQDSLTTFFSVHQHHRQVNVGKDTYKSFLSPTAGTETSLTNNCDSNLIPVETDVIAMRHQIPQHPPTTSNNGGIGTVDSADIGDTATSFFVGRDGPVINGGHTSLASHASDCSSPTAVIRDYGALGITPREQAQFRNVDEHFSPTRMDHHSQTGLSDVSTITTTNSMEDVGTEPTALNTSPASAEKRPNPNDLSDEDTPVSVPTANIRWLLLPSNTVPHEPRKLDCHWLNFPHLVADAPDVPQPEDLLFGSRKNLLANGIHKALRTARVAEPERLAMGWLLYIFSRWRIIPTRENFAKIPYFLRPTPEQINQPHPARIDMLPWPSLRLALMNEYSDSQLDETLELLACCVKLRWPWGREFLLMRDDGSRQLVDEFVKTLMSLEGWGVTREFAVAYPHLIEGLNLHIIEYNVA